MIVRNFDKYACEPANDYNGICYMAGIYGDGGRGMYATADQKELAWLQEAVEQYDATKRASLKLEAEVKRLKKANAKLRKQLPAKKPNRKAVAV